MAKQANNHANKAGNWMVVLAMLVVLGLLWLFFNGQLAERENPNRHLRIAAGAHELVLKQNYQGHYLISGEISSHPVVFLLDTGATDVVVSERLAQKLNLKKGIPVRAKTANGTITNYTTQLAELRLGPFTLEQVPASINPQEKEAQSVLLGMSVLRNFELVQRGKTLTLRPAYP